MSDWKFFSGKLWLVLAALVAVIVGLSVINSIYRPFRQPPPIAKTIDVTESTCRVNADHIIWIRNIGDVDMSTDEVSVKIDSSIGDCWSWSGDIIVNGTMLIRAGDLVACISTLNATKGRHEITVSGPANTVSASDVC